jgi:hypothetical protein
LKYLIKAFFLGRAAPQENKKLNFSCYKAVSNDVDNLKIISKLFISFEEYDKKIQDMS